MEISNIFISLIRKPEKKDSLGSLIGGVRIKTDVAKYGGVCFRHGATDSGTRDGLL